jgi:hypothetical protein
VFAFFTSSYCIDLLYMRFRSSLSTWLEFIEDSLKHKHRLPCFENFNQIHLKFLLLCCLSVGYNQSNVVVHVAEKCCCNRWWSADPGIPALAASLVEAQNLCPLFRRCSWCYSLRFSRFVLCGNSKFASEFSISNIRHSLGLVLLLW